MSWAVIARAAAVSATVLQLDVNEKSVGVV